MENIKEIISKMTLKDKARILTGKDFWHTREFPEYNIPSIMVSDGPSGLRKQNDNSDNLGINGSQEAVCYPPAACIACSFDKDLVKEFGENLGEEGNFQEINVLLAPAINIQRSPLCGRNFEYFSEDPLLTGILASEYVKGVQSKGIGTCLKHYAVNSQEKMRFISDSIVDDRALFEIYLKAFKIVVENAKPTSVMTAYNKVNGEHIAESKFFMQEFMREKCKFDGAFVSDWGATSDIVESIKTGLNLEMPGGELNSEKAIINAINDGRLKESELDDRVYELLNFVFKSQVKNLIKDNMLKKHLDFAQKSLEESAVLLKNENILPFSKDEKVLYIGEFCLNPRCQGAGSCKVNIVEKDSIIEALKIKNIPYDFVQGYTDKEETNKENLITSAVNKAKDFDKIVIVVGYPEYVESEGYDRDSLELPDFQEKLIEEVAKINKNIVVILNCGSPVSMKWKDNVSGIIYENFCGSKGGNAITNILYGDVNPSGKLNQTFPIKVEDTPCYDTFAKENRNVIYKESIYVGYRYYLSCNKNVLYNFGYGLSYTTFDISLLENKNNILKVKVKNTGKIDGKEVVQLYYGLSSSKIFRPKLELFYFEKVFLKAGEEKILEIKISPKMFSFYNTQINDYDIESGNYDIFIGNSSDNLVVKTNIEIKGNDNLQKIENGYFEIKDNNFPLSEFEKICNKKIIPYVFKKPYNIDSTVSDLKMTFIGRQMAKMMSKNQNTQGEMAKKALNDLPLRTVLMAGYSREFLQGMVDIANGHIFRGLNTIKKK